MTVSSINWAQSLVIVARHTHSWIVHTTVPDPDQENFKEVMASLRNIIGNEAAMDIMIYGYDLSFHTQAEAEAVVRVINNSVDFWCLVSPVDGIVAQK